jgi:hypothetical protein
VLNCNIDWSFADRHRVGMFDFAPRETVCGVRNVGRDFVRADICHQRGLVILRREVGMQQR